MKNYLKTLFVIIVVASAGAFIYNTYFVESDIEMIVDCEYNYLVESNSMSVTCSVGEEETINLTDYPLVLALYDNNDILVSDQVLQDGTNEISLNSLNYNSKYSITVDGYNYIKSVYIQTNFFSYDFSTVREDVVVPTWIFSEKGLSDIGYHFSIEVIDISNVATSIDITLHNSSNQELLNQNFTDLDNLEFSFTDLTPESTYYINIKINYIINDYNKSEVISIPQEFTSLKTLYLPTADFLDVVHDSENLTFNLVTENKDATNVVYTISIIDLERNVLYSEIATDSDISLNIDEIVGNYYVSIKASYLFNGNIYNDVEIAVYRVFNNSFSNFFLIPNLDIVDTSVPLSRYDNYDDYLYTHLNNGDKEFTIYCEAPVDCSELVLNNMYTILPFEITDLVHSYFDIIEINYSYTSTELNFVLVSEYDQQEIDIIDLQIDNILSTIITEYMTDYEKVLVIHDYIINNVTYDIECVENLSTCNTDHSAIGVFVEGSAVCEGYSHAMDIMLRELYIPTFKISSLTHQWNAVYVDGTWYHIDVTWDDPVTHNNLGILIHDFFLINTDDLHTLDSTGAHISTSSYGDFIE